MTEGYLVLQDGTVFEGTLFGSETGRAGDIVFSTGGVDGYQESLTDPASSGQIIVLTFPCVGNYGIKDEFNQSGKIHARGLVVRELCTEPSPQYGGTPLDDFMKENGAVGISGVDTREVTLRIRRNGNMKAAIVKADADIERTVRNLNNMASISRPFTDGPAEPLEIDNGKGVKVAVIDCGARKGLYDVLSSRFDIIKFPMNAPSKGIIDSGADAVIVSSGPGNPNDPAFGGVISTIKEVSKKLPVMGISLGCDLLAIALGAKVVPMKYGHHGCNQPVKVGGYICMTSQSHEYCVDIESAKNAGLVITQTNLNDGTVEGFTDASSRLFGYEYHPEGHMGPTDTEYQFDDFAAIAKGAKQ